MKKEEIVVLAHLLTSMRDAISGLDDSLKKKDNEKIMMYKKEILALQKEVDKLL